MYTNQNTVIIELEDYYNKIYTMEIPTEELITSFNNTFMNRALNELNKYLKKQINYEKGESKK
jgi:hypothetical protein|tara:strand:+ start:354 stop:542 length:189 start_codon:yes stop_codon:yes gene_type:complete